MKLDLSFLHIEDIQIDKKDFEIMSYISDKMNGYFIKFLMDRQKRRLSRNLADLNTCPAILFYFFSFAISHTWFLFERVEAGNAVP